MKLIDRYILLAAAFSLAACSQDDSLSNGYLDDSAAVHITAQIGSDKVTGGFLSRSNPLGSSDDQAKFNAGDAISVVADNQEAVVYSFDGTNWSPKEDGQYLLWNSDEMTFKAFYPANANGASFTNFTLPVAYNSLEDLALGDYMTFSGSRKRNSSDDGVNLQMERKMARIVVNLRGWGDTMEDGLQITEVTIHPNTKGYSNGELVEANSEDVSVKAFLHEDGNFYALITPTLPVTDTYNYLLFMTVKVAKADGSGEQEFEVRRLPGEGMKAGISYEYSLKIGKDALVVAKVTVSDWKTGEVIPGGEALDDAEFIKKTIAEALDATKTDIELTLPTDAGKDVFQAIQESFEGVTESSIKLTLKGCEEIPESGLYSLEGLNALKSISLPDVTKIGKKGLYACTKLEEVYAPNVTSIGELAFARCYALQKVT